MLLLVVVEAASFAFFKKEELAAIMLIIADPVFKAPALGMPFRLAGLRQFLPVYIFIHIFGSKSLPIALTTGGRDSK